MARPSIEGARPAIHGSNPFRRLLKIYLVLLLALSLGSILWGLARNGTRTSFDESFSLVFFLGGIPWLVFAYLSGGFVGTYRGATANPWYYTVRGKGRLVLPVDNPATIRDLRTKMAHQTSPMVIGAMSGFGLFGLSALFYYASTLGYAALIAAMLIVAIGLLAGAVTDGRRPRGASQSRGPRP